MSILFRARLNRVALPPFPSHGDSTYHTIIAVGADIPTHLIAQISIQLDQVTIHRKVHIRELLLIAKTILTIIYPLTDSQAFISHFSLCYSSIILQESGKKEDMQGRGRPGTSYHVTM